MWPRDRAGATMTDVVAESTRSAGVEFHDVAKRFGATEALHGISVELPDRQITAIVGESGSGKSTLLQHINGMLRPDRGDVYVFEKPIDYHDLTTLRRRIGYAVQGVGLFPHLTVAGNVGLLARLDGWSDTRRTARINELMRLMELDLALAERYPHTLSGGQQQRVGLCRAWMMSPPLLLLDEPFSGLDPVTRSSLHERILVLQEQSPIAIVLVTHDMREAERLATYLVVLRHGTVVQHGPMQSLLANPHPYVRELLGASQ
jgi:osmoprotectant transport system ATP-binding protein